MITFDSRFEAVGTLPRFDESLLRQECGIFAATPSYAASHGGKVHKAFIDGLPAGWRGNDLIVDSRIHMLMKGWYPCIPGWHLDDVPRTRPDKQPDHTNPVYKAEHIMAIVGDSSLTEYIQDTIKLEDVPINSGTVYAVWNEQINAKIVDGACNLPKIVLPSVIYHFDWQSFHRGMPATKSGWRLFIRVTRDSHRKHFNEVRTQTQVYMSALEAGW